MRGVLLEHEHHAGVLRHRLAEHEPLHARAHVVGDFGADAVHAGREIGGGQRGLLRQRGCAEQPAEDQEREAHLRKSYLQKRKGRANPAFSAKKKTTYFLSPFFSSFFMSPFFSSFFISPFFISPFFISPFLSAAPACEAAMADTDTAANMAATIIESSLVMYSLLILAF